VELDGDRTDKEGTGQRQDSAGSGAEPEAYVAEQTDGADRTPVASERSATTRKSTTAPRTVPAKKRAPAKAGGAKTGDASPRTRGRIQEKKGSTDKGGEMKGDSSVKRDGVRKTQPGRKGTSSRRTTAERTAGDDSDVQVAPTEAEERPTAATDLAESARLLVVRPDEDPWSPEELAEVYHELAGDVSRLESELHSATDELADLLRDSGDGAGDDQADAGSKTFEREHEMSLANNTREMLEQTERAVARIGNGTYGVCEGCANPIGKARLLAFPRATLCVSCKQKEERR
jgi:RNA polymerase-binding protein DksA